MNPAGVSLVIALAVQAVFFAFAASLRTDKVTDLSYGLTFIVLAAWSLASSGRDDVPALAVVAMITAWGLRLAAYLLRRIIHMKRDARFDGVRERFWPFFKFWLFQGIAVWAIMLPVTLWYSARPADTRWSMWMTAGALLWAFGLVIEAVADQQKFAFKQQRGARWTNVGLWRWSRHPNYFGELTCWWGLFLVLSPGLIGVSWFTWAVGLVGPIAITVVILFLTGVPQLEASADKRWGHDLAYQRYKATTNRLWLWPPERL